MSFKLLFLLASLFTASHAQGTYHISIPKAGDTIPAGQNTTIQIVRPISTSAAAGFVDVGIAIGIVGCSGGSAGCPDPSKDMGTTLFAGPFNPQVHQQGSLDAFENFTVFIPGSLSGTASIQVGRFYLNTIMNQPTAPVLEFTEAVVNVGSAPPPSSAFTIHPNGDNTKCVGILGGLYANGTNVDIFDCNQSVTQKWQWNGGALTSINPVDQSQWCLDAGLPAQFADGVKMKIWKCFAGLEQQTWVPPTAIPGHIALSAGNFCLDLTNGDKTNLNILQIWDCINGNANQNWNFSPA